MKKAKAVMVKFVAGFALIVITFWGCKDELNKTGFNLLLPGDLITARKIMVDKTTIKSYTVLDDGLHTNKPSYNLLGTFNDPIFGKSTTDFACQFRVDTIHDLTGAIADSITLSLFYKEIYGDKVTPQNLKVYELNSDLYGADTYIYNQSINLKGLAYPEALSEIMYVPKFKLDSLTSLYGSTKLIPKDTLEQEILFKLNNSLADKLIMINDSLQKVKSPNNVNDILLKLFKGLYVEAGDLNEGGSIMRVRTLAAGSIMKLYYHNAKDTLVAKYKINSTSARTSHFEHNYSTTRFYTNLNKTQEQDTLIYLQTTGGLSDKIYLPTLSTWKDSVHCAINKAELIFRVEKGIKNTADTSFYSDWVYRYPERLKLSLIDANGSILDTLGNVIIPSDYALGDAYYGGYFSVTDSTYRFNLANHLQEIIKGKGNYGFYLTTDFKNSIFRRLVLKGARSKTGIRFDISYSKLK